MESARSKSSTRQVSVCVRVWIEYGHFAQCLLQIDCQGLRRHSFSSTNASTFFIVNTS